MKKYAKGNKVIRATEKAYNLLYKAQGFVPANGNKTSKTPKTGADEPVTKEKSATEEK